ncbi:MAG: glucose-6-phosphate isomerase [Deltaproteobacteria bacterium]|nr:glucose-6-phosphate isomerase [Deltaproteobacteria bacterium]
MDPWSRFCRWTLPVPGTGLTLDLSAMEMADLEPWRSALNRALGAMADIEAGAIANPDEGRQVGHYWLRTPDLAVDAPSREAIRAMRREAASLADRLRRAFDPTHVLHLGIGGSALGPQLLADALEPSLPGGRVHRCNYRVLDNTDPDGFERHLAGVDPDRSLVVVVSKSGTTVETRNALLRIRRFYAATGTPLPPRAVAVTQEGSALDGQARQEGWAGRLPLWDWVGGRTSVTGPVGLLPAWLLGIDADAFLAGAAAMDAATREPVDRNPAAWLASAWFASQLDRPRSMVVLPYADRLALFPRYLQQLVMESLGKRNDRKGLEIRAGLTVYGNKGSTDQHAFVQQLRDGPDDFFVTFVQVFRPGGPDPALHGEETAGDALAACLAGTRRALSADRKRSLTITLDTLDAATLGALVALYERTVGIYAECIDVNAYHQPGVEAGKTAMAAILAAQADLLAVLTQPATALDLAERAGVDPVEAWRILVRLATAGNRGVVRHPGRDCAEDRFSRG